MAKVPAKNRRKMVGVKERAKGAKRLVPVVLQTRQRINRKIATAVKNPLFATSEAVRQKLYNDIAQEYSKMQLGVNGYTKAYATSIARVWRKFAISDLKGRYNQSWGGFSTKYLSNIIRNINAQQVSGRAAKNAPKLRAQLGGMLEKDIRFLRNAVVEQARLGATEGLTAREIRINTQNAVLKARPAWQFIDSAGRTWKTDNYFKMLNKTLYNDVMNETYLSAMSEAGIDLITIEGGPSTVGDSCDEWVGRIVSSTGATKGFPTLDHVTSTSHVFGPNCNHWPGAVLPDELPEAKEQEAETREEVNKLEDFRRKQQEEGLSRREAHEKLEKLAADKGKSPLKLTREELRAA